LTPDFSTAELDGVEVDVGQPSKNAGQIRRECATEKFTLDSNTLRVCVRGA
jgi:hypothetical protein